MPTRRDFLKMAFVLPATSDAGGKMLRTSSLLKRNPQPNPVGCLRKSGLPNERPVCASLSVQGNAVERSRRIHSGAIGCQRRPQAAL